MAMPLFDFRCRACGATFERLVVLTTDEPRCDACGSLDIEKLMSAPSSLSGVAAARMPGPGDTSCCGSRPAEAGCAGPGSCCGRG